MNKRLAELDRPAQPAKVARVKQRRRFRLGGLPTSVTFVVAVALAVGSWWFGVLSPTAAASRSFGHDHITTNLAVVGTGQPERLVDHPHRLLPASRGPGGSGGFAFASYTPDGRWMRFDPCEPIPYVISGAEPFAGANDMLRSAIAELSAASGLRFVDQGATTELPAAKRPVYQPDRYGHRWAPALIAWTDAKAVPGLKGRVIGLGGGDGVELRGQPRLVTGIALFDVPDLVHMRSGKNGAVYVRSVLLHELGHLVGLDHVKIKSDVMYPEARLPLAHYGVGDLRGLAQLGQGRCFNVV